MKKKKTMIAVLVAAALAVSFSACGSTSDSNDSKDSVAEGFTKDEETSIKEAKQVLTDWYDHMNKAEISEAVKLMTPEYAAASGYDQAEDGQSLGTLTYEIDDEQPMISVDQDGNMIIVFLVKITAPEPQEVFMTVTCFESGALVSGDNGTVAEDPGAQTTTQPAVSVDISLLAEQYSALVYEAANTKLQDIIANGETVADGVYNSKDQADNELVKAGSGAVDPETYGCQVAFNLTVENGNVAKVELFVSDDKSTSVAFYPAVEEQ